MRQAYALLGLCDKFGDGRVEAICQSALAFDVVDVARFRTCSRPPRSLPRRTRSGKVVQLPLTALRFARPERALRDAYAASNKEGV